MGKAGKNKPRLKLIFIFIGQASNFNKQNASLQQQKLTHNLTYSFIMSINHNQAGHKNWAKPTMYKLND